MLRFRTVRLLLTAMVCDASMGATLQQGYSWIRAAREDPVPSSFDRYMQTNPVFTPPIAVLDDYETAGQFAVQNGQLVQLISAPGDTPEILYAAVATNKTHNGRTRAVSFTSKMSRYEAFDLEGSAVVWTDISDERNSNASAWWICEGNQLFINLGDYKSGTAKGCFDQRLIYSNDIQAIP